MLDAEQVIAEAFVESVYGPGVYGLHPSTRAGIGPQYAQHAAAALAALSSNGFHVFSERELWAHVRGRVLSEDAVRRAADHAGSSIPWAAALLRAALDAAERGTDASTGA